MYFLLKLRKFVGEPKRRENMILEDFGEIYGFHLLNLVRSITVTKHDNGSPQGDFFSGAHIHYKYSLPALVNNMHMHNFEVLQFGINDRRTVVAYAQVHFVACQASFFPR